MNHLDKNSSVAGIHVAGPNSSKSAVVILAGTGTGSALSIRRLVGRIGNYASHQADDRIIDILRSEPALVSAHVDCPLSLPPCVACTRPVCPGVVQCDDVEVSYMQSIAARRTPRKQRRTRPVNPQSVRLWDLLVAEGAVHPLEPTYSANTAPLATRARTLHRRLRQAMPQLDLRETSVPHALAAVAESVGLGGDLAMKYRNFELGHDLRLGFLVALEDEGWIDLDASGAIDWNEIAVSVELFQAFVAALVGTWSQSGLVRQRPTEIGADLGWVEVPELACKIPL